jgi:hypothetical protein
MCQATYKAYRDCAHDWEGPNIEVCDKFFSLNNQYPSIVTHIKLCPHYLRIQHTYSGTCSNRFAHPNQATGPEREWVGMIATDASGTVVDELELIQ